MNRGLTVSVICSINYGLASTIVPRSALDL
jgi:hypothetical protein